MEQTKLLPFFSLVLGRENSGIVCISKKDVKTGRWEDNFFSWPDDVEGMVAFIDRFSPIANIYFCPQLLDDRRRKKGTVALCPSAWADLDGCHPDNLLVRPSAVIESSPGRWQAYWRLTPAAIPADAENLSKRIALYHADDDADPSGWDLTQVLRVPFTPNHKYAGAGMPPTVRLDYIENVAYTLDEFDEYPPVESVVDFESAPPDLSELDSSGSIMMRYRNDLHSMVWMLFSHEPEGSWSESLWNLELLLFESGLTAEEVYGIVVDAKCNKYARDGRNDDSLWKEVLRAKAEVDLRQKNIFGISQLFDGRKPLLTEEEIKTVEADHTIVEQYVEWASKLGDAAPVYHPAGIFVILSAIISAGVRIPTKFGTITPNLWFMILADTTLTRKTTAMDIAMDLLEELDDNAVLATDGSIEGLFSALSQRPGRSSIFLRDEFSGLLDAMFKKDYMAGMAETLTKLYDGKYQKRILRRDTIEVRDPILILFAGGIKSRVYELLNYDQVTSGFLPRFIFITAESDITRYQPMGPPTVVSDRERTVLLNRLEQITQHYNQQTSVVVNGQVVVSPKKWNAELTPDAWHLYNRFEAVMVDQGLTHEMRDVIMPALDRLAKSGLKCAALIAASRTTDEKVIINEIDILHAFYYADQWRQHMLTVLSNIGKSPYEKLVGLVTESVEANPGIMRGTIMRTLHMSSKQADDIFTTAEERGLLYVVKSGKSYRLYPPGHKIAIG